MSRRVRTVGGARRHQLKKKLAFSLCITISDYFHHRSHNCRADSRICSPRRTQALWKHSFNVNYFVPIIHRVSLHPPNLRNERTLSQDGTKVEITQYIVVSMLEYWDPVNIIAVNPDSFAAIYFWFLSPMLTHLHFSASSMPCSGRNNQNIKLNR